MRFLLKKSLPFSRLSEKVKKLKEKPRERSAVIFFTDLLGVLRKPIRDTTKFFFSLPFLFPKRKGRSKIENQKSKSDP